MKDKQLVVLAKNKIKSFDKKIQREGSILQKTLSDIKNLEKRRDNCMFLLGSLNESKFMLVDSLEHISLEDKI